MTSLDRKLIALFAGAHTLVHIFEQALPALFPIIMVQFALSVTAAGNLQFGLALAFGLFALPAGWLATAWGARRVVQLFLLVAAAGAVAMAWAPNAAVLMAGAVAVGIGLGLYHPAGTSYISRTVRARSLAMGYHGMGGGLGVSTGPVLTVALAAVVGWSATLTAYAALAVAIAVVLQRMSRTIEPVAAPAGHADVAPAHPGTTDRTRLSVLLAAATMVGFVYRGVITFLPLYLGLALAGPDNPERMALLGGAFASGALYVGMAAQWLGGHLGERVAPTLLFALGHTASVPCLVLLATMERPVLVGAAALFAFSHFLAQPVGNVLVAEYSDRRYRDRAFGWYFALAFGLGAFGATVGGRVGEAFGLNTIFFLLATVAAIAVAAGWWLHAARIHAAAPVPQPAEA